MKYKIYIAFLFCSIIAPVTLSSGFNPIKIINNVLNGDPLNIGGGGSEAVGKLDVVLGKHLGNLSEMQKKFAKDNLVLIDEFHKGNKKNLAEFNENNIKLKDEFGVMVNNFNTSLESGFNNNIKYLSINAETQANTFVNNFFHKLNFSIIFIGFVLFIFILLLLNYSYYLFVGKKSLLQVFKTKGFNIMLVIGVLVGLGLYIFVTVKKQQEIKSYFSYYEDDFFKGRFSDAFVSASTLVKITENESKKKEYQFYLDKVKLTLEILNKPSWLTSDMSLDVKNREFLRLHKTKIDPDVFALQAYFNWTRAENKVNRYFAKSLALFSLQITKSEFALRNLAIEVVNGQNNIINDIESEIISLIDNKSDYESIFGTPIDSIQYNNINIHYGKKELAVNGMSPTESRIFNEMIDFRKELSDLYANLILKNDRIKFANEIIDKFKTLMDNIKISSERERSIYNENQNLINFNILLEAYSTLQFKVPLGYQEMIDIPDNITEDIFVTHQTVCINPIITFNTSLGSIGSSLKRLVKIEAKKKIGKITKKSQTISNPEKKKVELVFNQFYGSLNSLKAAININIPTYLESHVASKQLGKLISVDLFMLELKLLITSSKNAEQYISIAEITNRLGMNTLFMMIQDSLSKKDEYSNELKRKENLKKMLILEI